MTAGFTVDDGMLGEFEAFVRDRGMKVDDEAWQQDEPFIRAMVRFEIDVALFGGAAAREHLVETDPQTGFALTHFDEAVRLSRLSGNSAAKVGQ